MTFRIIFTKDTRERVVGRTLIEADRMCEVLDKLAADPSYNAMQQIVVEIERRISK